MLQLNQLGASDMWLTPVGFGAWAVGGGDWAFSWGPQDDDASIAAIHKAIDVGMNWIDTAAIYGLGHSEEIVGKAVRSSSVKPFIFTKSGMVWNQQREIKRTLLEIRREVEDSLRRLQVDAIDLYQIHWPIEDQDIEAGWTTMAELQREGKVKFIGVSNFSVAQMQRCLEIAPITSLQPPYSLLNRSAEAELLPFCLDHHIGVINYSPMSSGLLTGAMTKERVANLPPDDFRRKAKQFQEPLLSRNLALADLLGKIGARRGVTAGVIAIAWTLANPAITGAIVGGRSTRQVEEVWPASKCRLSGEEMQEIQAFLDANP
jgi:aryl-alcohol dehydrogenase-like predicted oxidoreductase